MSNTKQLLKADEVGVSPWFVTYDPSCEKWVVARNHDTIDTDFETGEICYGMRSEVDSVYDTEAEARERHNQIRWS